MNDKDFIFDFYIGDNDAKKTDKDLPINELPDEVESEILLNSFSDDEFIESQLKRGVFSKLADWWQKRKKWQKAIMISSVAVITATAILLSILYSGLGYNYNKITTKHEDLGIENIIDKDIVNVALFGLDTHSLESFKGNSDSIMVLSLNTKTKKVKIISLMRDSFVPITYDGNTTYNKINSAYSKGGPELAIKVINSNFGLDITEYATVNFFGMVDIIDAVGGIEAELTEREVVSSSIYFYALNGMIAEICTTLNLSAKDNFIETPGKHHLNGVQAVAYSRIRKVANIWGTNNDYGRTDRQRYVMEQLFDKALTLEKSQYIKIAKSLIPCTETSFTYREIIGLAFDMLLESPNFMQARIPCDEMLMPSPNTRAGSVVYYDLDFAKELIHAFIYDDITFDQYIEENGVEKNDWYTEAVMSQKPSNNNNASNSNKPSNNQNQNEYNSGNEEWDDTDSLDDMIEDESDVEDFPDIPGFEEDNSSNISGNNNVNSEDDAQNESDTSKENSDLNDSSDDNKTNSSDKNTGSSNKSDVSDSSDNDDNSNSDKDNSSNKNNSGTSSSQKPNKDNSGSEDSSSKNPDKDNVESGDSSSNNQENEGATSSDSSSDDDASNGSSSDGSTSSNDSSSNTSSEIVSSNSSSSANSSENVSSDKINSDSNSQNSSVSGGSDNKVNSSQSNALS